MRSLHLKDELQIFILTGLIGMGLATELDRLSPLVGIFNLGVLGLVALLVKPDLVKTKGSSKNSGPAMVAVGLGLGIIAPAFLFWLAQWSAEFPFGGDHDHHVFAALSAKEYWTKLVWLPVLWGAVVFFVWRGHAAKFPLWGAATLVGLWLLSPAYQVPEQYFSRYPALGYLFTAPGLALTEFFEAPTRILANQTVQFLSLPVWLFALRPLLLKRWPDRGALLFALLIYWQKDFIYYQAAAYLEPWSLVFIALALEMALTETTSRWRPLLLIGIATWFKETSILLLPFLWLGIYGRSVVKGPKSVAREGVLVGLVSVTPFVSYFAMRVHDKIWRNVEAAAFDKTYTAERLQEFWFRFLEQWQWTGVLALTILMGVWGWSFLRQRDQRGLVGWLLLGGLAQLLFYFQDSLSVAYTGYPRYHFVAYLALAAPLFLFARQAPESRVRALAVGLAALQISTLIPFYKIAFGSEPLRSFSEHYDSPTVFPIRGLLERAEVAGQLSRADKIVIVPPVAYFYPQSFAVGYPDLARKYKFAMAKSLSSEVTCGCSQEFKALLVPFVTRAGLRISKSMGEVNAAGPTACRARLQQTCQVVVEEIQADGQISGLLGVDVK